MKNELTIGAGSRFPMGATVDAGGVNFSVFSPRATRMWLRLYRGATDAEPLTEIELDSARNRTFAFWHVRVGGAQPGWFYTWRADGPNDPPAGSRFDATRELLDPWARLVSDVGWRRAAAARGEQTSIRAQIVGPDSYDWEGDEPLRRPLEESVIYELHVRGFTRHASSCVEHPGTYRGLIEKIPHLAQLGVTHVELLPVFAFDRQEVPPDGAALGLSNFWGYSPFAPFAPHPHYAASADVRSELRDLVKALHRAGLGVILDVVLNHTAEGGDDGVTIGYRGLANEVFYLLDPADRAKYANFTGTGNTLNSNHPFVAGYIRDCLAYWAREMHVDGFRLDLASSHSRGEDGEPLANPPALWNIELAPELEGVHLIAEPWDAAGLYQLGSFPGFRWAEWNGRYRDSVRRFLSGEGGSIGEVATRIAGSSDQFALAGKAPQNGINFVTCHDGFTLYDLVSYDRKHNEANAEHNRDGRDDNYSWNSGIEGPTDDPGILRVREQRARNHVAILLLSQGVPMLLGGDEVLRSQLGNNNAYCQDNPISWVDWSFSPAARGMLRFTRELIALRKRHPSLRRTRFLDDGSDEIRWYGENGEPPDWTDPEARLLCFTLAGLTPAEPALHVLINMAKETKSLPLPRVAPLEWRRIADTTLAPPDDVTPGGVAMPGVLYRLPPHGLAIFEAR
ncbi:MAG TPA: glycogen debranching protein GlgX [Gammaproteobacteria bacterium]|nr:glycogen debranching protein GlgX [Gammaproteobacteria bacterium]